MKSRIAKRCISIFQMLSGELSPLLFNGSWTNNRQICYRDIWGGISLLDVSNIISLSLMPNETFVSFFYHCNIILCNVRNKFNYIIQLNKGSPYITFNY